MRFTLKQLEYFAATAEAGSIKLASERINISQPSISGAISHLESELKLQLFVRHHAKGLVLTSSGERILREVDRLLRQCEGLNTIAGELRNEMTGRLSVGCMVTLAPMIVPVLENNFMKKYPQVVLSFHEGSHEVMLSKLKKVEVDLAISYDLQFPDDILFEPLAILPPQVLLSTEHPLADKKAITLDDLEGQPMILLDLPYSRQYFVSIFQNAGHVANIFARSSNPEVVRSMVARGFGFTITNVRPRSAVTLDGRSVKTVKLAGKHKPMMIGIAKLLQNAKPKALNIFEQHCRELVSDQGIPGMLPVGTSNKN